MTQTVNPSAVAQKYVAAIGDEIRDSGIRISVLGLIASNDRPSVAYANATKKQFESVGISYELCQVERLQLEQIIQEANLDNAIHGIFIYFPVFNNRQDDYLRNLVDYRKDIEAGSMYWTRKLYTNERFAVDDDRRKKALLPCTPLAIVKLLSEVGCYGGDGVNDDVTTQPIEDTVVTIFNRSEVIGRPLAMMMSNDGAKVYSFDVNGPLLFRNAEPQETEITRTQALAESDIVITGVPGDSFARVSAREIRAGTTCVNFSSVENYTSDVAQKAGIFIPRVGPMTVAMCMRNTLRLYRNFHEFDHGQ